jgi:hypothetical protein
MDLSRLSDDDIRALRDNNIGAVSDAGIKFLAAGGQEAPKKKGVGAALGKGFESTLSSGQTTLESLFGANKAAERGLQRGEEIGKKYEDQIGLDRLKQAYEQRGLTGAGGELLRQVPLALAEQTPNIAASLASAKVGAMGGSAFGPAGTVIGGIGGALAPSALQLFGSNVERQAAEQKQAGQPTDINVGRAVGATAIQAPLDVVATYIPLGGKIAGKIFGPEVEKLLMRGGTKAAEKLAQEGFAKTLGKGLLVGAAAEIPTEITQQMLERAQAGLPLTSPDALKEYGEVAYQSGLLAPIGGAGRFVDKSGARTQVEATKKAEQDRVAAAQQQEDQRIAQEAEQAQQAQELQKAQQDTGNLFGEAAPEASLLQTAPSTLTVAEREAQAAEQATTQETERSSLIKQADLYDKQLLDIEKQRDAAAEKGDFKTFGALDSQARALEESIGKVNSALKKMPVELSPEMEMAKLRGEQKNLIKQLQGMTGPSYDAKKAATVTAKLEDIDKRITEITPAAGQMDMFDPAKMQAEQNVSLTQQKEARTQEQEDLFAQVQAKGGKEVLNEEAINRYQKGLQDLEDAYAAGADERIINRLIDELQKVGADKDEAVAKAQGKTGPQQEEELAKIARIARAIDEENAKLYSATTNEEISAIRANVGALQKRYAAAQSARAKGQPENVEIEASQEQRDAILQAVEGARAILSGDYLNSRNVDVASSFKSGLEAKIRDAGALYTASAIKEINAVREIGKQQPITNDEALKVASAVKERFDYIANDPTYLANREIEISRLKDKLKNTAKADTKRIGRLEASISELEKNRNTGLKTFQQALDRIKSGYFKGASRLQKATPDLKQERDPLAMLRNEMAKKEPDQKRIAQLQKEIAAGKKEDDRIEAEKAKKEQVELPGVNPDQKDLFAAKDLEPIAEVRATPANFMRFVGIQANKFKQAKEAAERALKIPMQKVEQLLGKKYALHFAELEKTRLELENLRAKQIPEAYVPTENDLKNYTKQFINDRTKKAAKVKEAHLSKIKELEDREKGILRVIRGVETDTLSDTLFSQIEQQKRFIDEVAKADEMASNLRFNAEQLWTAKAKIQRALANATKKEAPVYEKALKQLEEQAPEISKAIDSFHARANELLNANINVEKAILRGLEKKLAASTRGSAAQIENSKRAAAVRAQIGIEEEAIRKQQEKQIKEKRVAEQKALESKEALPSTTRETVETLKKVKGKGQEVLRREKTTRREVPLTAQEKREQAVAKSKEGAAERKADKEAIAERLSKGLSGTVANAKEQLVSLEAKLEKVEKDIKDSQSKKATPAGAVRRKEMAALQKQLKDAVTKLKEKGVAAERGAETIGAQPGRTERVNLLKTGVKKVDVTKLGMKAVRDVEQEARDVGVSREDFELVDLGLAFGFKPRAEKAPATTGNVSQADVKKELAKIKIPKGLKIVIFDKLGGSLAEKISAAGHDPKQVRGGVLPDGTVIFVAENHTDLNDVKQTIAHELIGHLGVEQLLGEAGMKALAKQIQKTENSVFDLAEKLGVLDDVLAAYANARRTKSEEDSVLNAVRELIAHVEETRPTRNMLETAKAFIKALVGAVRAALRKRGVDLEISTSDIYKLLRDARKQFNEGSPGAYVNKDNDIMFRVKPAVANAGFANVLNYSDKIVAKEKSFIDKIKGEATGLIFKTKYIDRFAPIQAVANQMKDALKATQLMYFLRMHDQRMSFTSEVASNGPLDLKPAKDGKGLIIESETGANLKDMAAALKDADVGNAEATSRIFTMYLAAKRAANPKIGLAKLNFGPDLTQKMLDDTMKAVNGSPSTKAAFEKAAGIYAEYNKGLINFAVKTGAIPKDIGAQLTKDGDYVPFYRQRSDGSVFLEIGGAPAIKIGNLADQPYLHELVGGDKPIYDVYTSALQNTAMLTDMALRNLATRNTAFALGDMGLLKVGEKEKGVGLHKGDGPKGVDTLRFKIDGENYWATVNTNSIGIPAELLIKGMEGVNTSLPNAVKLMNIPANLLRKWVTRNPAYALRQVVRDPLNAVFTTGLDTVPIVSSFKEISKMIRGKSEGEPLLQRRGILGGQVLTGTSEDMTKILRDVTAGKKGWEYRMAQLDQLAIQGDAATRVVMYNNFIKQGLSEMEATLATLESMNFSKRGISPSLFALSTMVPFMNAQIQGLNVIYQAFTGKMPFNEKLKVKQKLVQRAIMMAGFTMLYASMMQDDEAYQNANDDEKYGNWFLPNPFSDEYIKVPIPFEVGLLFKAIPEALVNTVFGDEKARDTMAAIGKMAWNSIPISGPQGVKPLLEVAINHSFFTGRDIESARLQQYEPGERYTERTSEIAKLIGGTLNISPVKLEYLIRGYTGSLPLAIASLSNPILRSSDTGEQPESRGLLSSETPLVGSFFQAKDAGGLINKAYKDMNEIVQTKETYDKMVEEGREKEADEYATANADMLGMGTMAGSFRKKMGELTKAERNVRAATNMSGAQKRAELDAIRQDKIQLAKDFSSERE